MKKGEKNKTLEEAKSCFNYFLYMHDYDTNITIIKPNKSLLLAEKTLTEILPQNVSIEYEKISKFKCIQITKRFFKTRFKLHKILVGNDKKIYKKLNNKTFDSFEDVVKAYEATCALVSPFKIPVFYNHDELVEDGQIAEESYPAPLNINLIENELRKCKIIFKSIILKGTPTKLTPGTYIHEITHSQLNSVKGAIKKYYDSELLSIFLENVYFIEECEKEMFIINTLERIMSILNEIAYVKAYDKNEISKEQKYEFFNSCKYLISTIKAYHLLSIYRDCDEFGKKHIISRIQEIFDGKYTLEELLTEFNITYYNSLEPETLKKSFAI